MKFVIIRKNKSRVHLLKSCNSQDLVTMGVAIIKESIRGLMDEDNISKEDAEQVVKEIINESIFI